MAKFVERKQKIGNLGVFRGKDGDIRHYSWDAVQKCKPDECGIGDVCKWAWESDKCKVHLNYIVAVHGTLERSFGRQLTNSMRWRVGMHLIPLYSILCKLLMTEYGNVGVYAGGKMNPVYSEIRSTIASVEKLWKDLGLDELMDECGLSKDDLEKLVSKEMRIVRKRRNGRKVDDFEEEENYYERMERASRMGEVT